MEKIDDNKKNLFQSRKDRDVIAEDFTKALIVDKDSEEKKNENQILEDEAEEELDEAPNHDQNRLKIVATPHNTYFILLMSVLIGLAFCLFLSLVFPINTNFSFEDHIPSSELNLHSFRIGSDHYNGNVIRSGPNLSTYVSLNASNKGLVLNITKNVSVDAITFNGSDSVFWIYPTEYPTVYMIHSVTNVLETSAFSLNGLEMDFHYDPIIFDCPFEVYGIVYCDQLMLSDTLYKADGTCEKVVGKTSIILHSQKEVIQKIENQYKKISSFGKVDSFAVSFPYVAVSDSNEIRIFKITGKHFSLIFKSTEDEYNSQGKVEKVAENVNTFIWGDYIYFINKKENVNKVLKNNTKIDKKCESLNEIGYRIRISSNSSGIYFTECFDDECSASKEIKVSEKTATDLKIDLDDDQRPTIFSNSLKAAFYADSSFEISMFEEIPLFYEDADDAELLTYSDQLLYLKDHELKLYEI